MPSTAETTVDDDEFVLVDRIDDEAVTVVTLNRPRARNAVDDRMRAALTTALDEVTRSDARVIVLTGSGTAFCAGGDIKAMDERLRTPPGQVALAGWRRQHRTFALTSAVRSAGQVTIAAVNGPAAGLGMDLALACDFIVAGGTAGFAASFVHRGLIPDGGSLHYLPRRVGLQIAKDLLLSGRTVDAGEAQRIGLIDHLAEGDVVAAAREYAKRFSGQPIASLMLTKSILNQSFELTLPQVAALGAEAQAMCYTTDEHRSSVEQFVNRRG